ncbi:protein catecholamines up-like [Brevipalpus obovatus]|uniref:protein catecholamines up-like n=1 Tax=Brevipalpus obovatus TaxID=246614 RepID=UPI003D9F4B7A
MASSHVVLNPQIWLYAIGSTLLISFVPFVILFFIPLDNSAKYRPHLKVLLSFACGGLLGDAFLHLIPHALIAQQSGGHGHAHGHGHGHGHDHGPSHHHHDEHSHHHHGDELEESHEHDMTVGLWVLAGVLAFLMVEKLVRIARGPGGHGHSHSPSSNENFDVKESNTTSAIGDDDVHSSKETEQSETQLKQRKLRSSKDISDDGDATSKLKKVRFASTNKIVTPKQVPEEEIKVAGYLNLAADFFHNLTDGLAIGATFVRDPKFALATTVTILFHEIPHEIGDFAILIQSGCSRRKAMYLQLITAFGALLGTIISLLYEGTSETASTWILPFTAGGFIYIACVSVIPEILKETNFVQSVFEIIAAGLGVGIMVLIAENE